MLEEEKKIASLEEDLRRKSIKIRQLEDENLELKNSTSYKIGNLAVKPLKLVSQQVKKVRLLPFIIKRILILMRIRGYFKPQSHLRRLILDSKRKSLSHDGKSALIYVIYEEDERIKEYKLIFLEALAHIVDEVLIVVNNSITNEDQEILEKYGSVLSRENIGYDTGAFRDGILHLGIEKIQKLHRLYLVNDTNLGPFTDLEGLTQKMSEKPIDFWGISLGEEQPDFTEQNPYGYIPKHIQSYFLVIEEMLLKSESFWSYWVELTDTNSRYKAIGKHETRFTKYFSDLGFRYAALLEGTDSLLYIHPLKALKKGSPLIKYSALKNFDAREMEWAGVTRESEIPSLIEYVKNETTYPVQIIESIVEKFKKQNRHQFILIIDGVEDRIPQCTRYRVTNKAEQLRHAGYNVKIVNLSRFDLLSARDASSIIIYRCTWSDTLEKLVDLAHSEDKKVYYDIDDLVFSTTYTDQLQYTQSLPKKKKKAYDLGVDAYKKMLQQCDVGIASTQQLKEELLEYLPTVYLNRNKVSSELLDISNQEKSRKEHSDKVRIGFFSGSITHNDNFDLIKGALVSILDKNSQVELHIVGHLDIPAEMEKFKDQIVSHDYVDWDQLPHLISQVDINLAPLVSNVFNAAKSEIKWLEAAIVEVVTVASRVGAFEEMIDDGVTGILVGDDQWEIALQDLIDHPEKRDKIAAEACRQVVEYHTLWSSRDELVEKID